MKRLKNQAEILEENNDNENEFYDDHNVTNEMNIKEVEDVKMGPEIKRVKNILDQTNKNNMCRDTDSMSFIDDAVRLVPLEDRNKFGYICKWIIDYGRVKYIQSHLNMKNAKTVRYIEDSISPENHLILASTS